MSLLTGEFYAGGASLWCTQGEQSLIPWLASSLVSTALQLDICRGGSNKSMRQSLRSATRSYILCAQSFPQVLKPALRLSSGCNHIRYPSVLPPIQVARYETVSSTVREGQKYDQGDDESGPTIYALSTAPGRAAIAIVRISGPQCVEVRDMPCANISLTK